MFSLQESTCNDLFIATFGFHFKWEAVINAIIILKKCDYICVNQGNVYKIWCKNDKNVCLINILKGMYHNFIPGVLYKQRLQTVDNAVMS